MGLGGFQSLSWSLGRAGSRESGSLGAQVRRVCRAPSLSLLFSEPVRVRSGPASRRTAGFIPELVLLSLVALRVVCRVQFV